MNAVYISPARRGDWPARRFHRASVELSRTAVTAKEQAEPSRRRVYGRKAAFVLARVLILVAPHLQTAGLGTGVVLGCLTLTVLLLLPASNSVVPKWRRFPIVGTD